MKKEIKAQTRGVWRKKSRVQSFPVSWFFQPISHEVLISWKETPAGKIRCFYVSLMHSHPPLTQRNFKSIVDVNSGHDAPKDPTNQSSNWTFTPGWYLGIKGCRMMQEILHWWTCSSKGTKEKGKAYLRLLQFFLLPQECNSAKQGVQHSQVVELMIWHMPQPIHSQHFRFNLCSTLDNQQHRTSLSNPIFPVASSFPSKHICITGSFGDLPPANHHHQMPKMLSADVHICQKLVMDPLQDQGQGGKSTSPAELSTHHSHKPSTHVQENREKQNKSQPSYLPFTLPPQEVKRHSRTQQSSP